MTTDLPVTIVSATKVPSERFDDTYLGQSLNRFPDQIRPALRLHAGNSGDAARGLGELYNESLDELGSDEIVVFIHDDVYVHDWFLGARVLEGLRHFDLLGIAGSINPDPRYPAWGQAFDENLNPLGPQEGLEASGAVARFDYVRAAALYFGPMPRSCRLLDGLLLAGRVGRWRETGLRFDPEFQFNHYDLDLCRTAERLGLSIGTWPISVTHNGHGHLDTDSFRDSAKRYLNKWGSS